MFTGAAQIDAGGGTNCVTMPSHTAICWGQGDQGQRGNGSFTATGSPDRVDRFSPAGTLPNVAQVTVGNAHACARTTGGRAFCWGDNSHSQTGNVQFEPPDYAVAVPVRVEQTQQVLTGVRQLSAGYDHTCALVARGEVRCWGRGSSRQLGFNGLVGDRAGAVPVVAPSGSGRLRNAIQIASGGFHTCALLTDHTVRCWGTNSIGELGGGFVGPNRLRAVRVVAPTGTAALRDVRSISAGISHTCALLTSGQVRCWGYDASHQLGTLGPATNRSRPVVVRTTSGAALTNVVQIAAGSDVTCARLRSGQVRCWGADGRGQRGDGTTAGDNGARPVLRAAGSVVDPGGPGVLTGARQVTVGAEHACARVDVGGDIRVQCWGDNVQGQTTRPTGTTFDRPVSAFAQPDLSE